ncbi:MAG: ATP-dependent helicase [Deltaproteobacteria bacterium]|nr:MAG: ATP-dependent helicase [Deltaproteobacteria bacterium]
MQKQLNLQKNKLKLHNRFEEALNPSQLEAVRHMQGPLLVIAGAGSGKTRTLIYRVAHLVEEGVPPASILLLTFTRKAASEMLNRAARLLDDRCERVSGGTFHSFANAILHRYASKIGFDSGFTILDRADSESLIGMLRKEYGAASGKRAFPRKQTLINIFSRAVNKVLTLEEVILKDYSHFVPHLDIILNIFEAYRVHKIEHNLLDFDDLLVYLHTLLKNYPAIRERLSSNYRYIMVDEYQDTNLLQADILVFLASVHNNVMAVGDDAQSIYAFRGANFKNIMNYPDIFPGTKIIKLEENYRSVQPILNLTNVIIDRATEKYKKNLFSRKSGGMRPLLVDAVNERGQSRFVTEKILEIQQRGIPLDQIAVLFRASFHSFDLEIELSRAQVPFIKVGGFKFTESAHIKDVLAHLKVIANPYDRLSWYRILLLLKKVGTKTAQNLYETVAGEKLGYRGILKIAPKSKQSRDIEKLKELFAGIQAESMTAAQMGEAVINYYCPILQNRFDDYPKRLIDLEQLVTIMDRYRDLEGFLCDMALDPPNTSVNDNLATGFEGNKRLVLSTVHSAKGLEWHSVFIIWALDGRFPLIHALNSQEELEEELRLMYVAATRAKENLFITYPSQVYDRGSGLVLSRPARFIDMITDNILDKYTLAYW